jgi:hypothetical protein
MEEPFDIMNFLNGFKKSPNPESEKPRLKAGTKIKIKKGALIYLEKGDVYATLQSEVEAITE